nr:ribonuclease h [Quercus suber]
MLSAIVFVKGKTYVVFVGRVPGVYDTWEEACAQVHQYSGADHKAFKHKMEVEVAFMKFWHIDDGNALQDSSSSTYSTHSISSSSTPSTEESPYYIGDVKYDLLKYQLDIAIEQRNHAIKIAKLNARMLNAVASQVLPDDELNKMAHLNLGE